LNFFNKTNHYINTLSLKDKVLLYLIPLSVLLFIIFNFDTRSHQTIDTYTQKKIEHYKNLSKQLKNNAKSINFIAVIKEFEKAASKNKITIKSTDIQDSFLTIKATGKLRNIINFLNYCENYGNYSKIETIHLLPKTKYKRIELNLKLSLGKIISKKSNSTEIISKIKELKNPFFTDKNNNTLKMVMILNDSALINKKWYTTGDNIGKYLIKNISPNYVIVSDKNKDIKLELFKDDFTK